MKISDERFRELAREQHDEGVCEIDDDAAISRANDEVTSAYVQAWVWVVSDDDLVTP
ncbi:hypothetical protein LCGC14_2059500 [marine sediment metagenome]|uniref:Uncharacterized protein n=1 Tax=marine sediment metagenome TaxID=412755 RepID=A0A0F9F905_9ZZZZ